jgi:hypothetical protein
MNERDRRQLRTIYHKVKMLNDWHKEINEWRQEVDRKLSLILILLSIFGSVATALEGLKAIIPLVK